MRFEGSLIFEVEEIMIMCKNQCVNHERTSKHSVYEIGGCYCRICDYYFKENFLRCPCCHLQVRHGTRSNRRKSESEITRVV